MGKEHDWIRLSGASAARQGRGPGLLGRVLSMVMAGALLVLALMFSAVIFAVLAVLGLVAGAWLWWKSRDLRRQMRAAEAAWCTSSDGDGSGGGDRGPATTTTTAGVVIEGEVVRVSDEDAGPSARPFHDGDAGGGRNIR